MARRHFFSLVLILMSGCAAAVPVGVVPQTETAIPATSPDTLCDRARTWSPSDDAADAQVIAPQVQESDNGRTYHFDLPGRAGLRTLDASCGWGSYAECSFVAVQADGHQYQFSDLSTFGLWEYHGALYLLYRIVDPKDAPAAAKRRLVKLDHPPSQVCNQIGDYSDLM